jgi:hypothetical protein
MHGQREVWRRGRRAARTTSRNCWSSADMIPRWPLAVCDWVVCLRRGCFSDVLGMTLEKSDSELFGFGVECHGSRQQGKDKKICGATRAGSGTAVVRRHAEPTGRSKQRTGPLFDMAFSSSSSSYPTDKLPVAMSRCKHQNLVSVGCFRPSSLRPP